MCETIYARTHLKCRAVFTETRYRYLLIRSKKASNQKIPDSASGCERCFIKKPAHKSPFFFPSSIFYSISQGSILFPLYRQMNDFFFNPFCECPTLNLLVVRGRRACITFQRDLLFFFPFSLPFPLQLSVFSPLNADWLRSVSLNIWMVFSMEEQIWVSVCNFVQLKKKIKIRIILIF